MANRIEIRAGTIEKPPRFKPWLGSNYLPRDEGSDLARWHVMGESHYSDPEDPRAYIAHEGLTEEAVRDWAFEKSAGSRFFTRVSSIVENVAPDMIDRERSWHNIAYSVFVQEVLDGPRRAPTKSQWEDARARFFSQLALTRPSLLVVLGRRQWQQLPWEVGAKVPKFQFAVHPNWPAVEDAWLYPFWDGEEFWCTLAINVVHPSAGFGKWNWQVAAQRAHSAWLCYSNIIEHFYDNYKGVGERPFWSVRRT